METYLTFPIPAGSKLHFRVFDRDLGWGSTWRIKTKAHTSDVYLEHMEGRRWLHSSFHQSGETHYGLSDRALREGEVDAPEYLEVVLSSFPVALGVFHAARITVAASELSTEYTEEHTPANVFDIPAFVAWDATTVNVYLIDPEVEIPRFPDQTCVAVMERGESAGLAVILAAPTRLDVPIHVGLADVISDIYASLGRLGKLAFPSRFSVPMRDPDRPGLQRQVEVLLTGPQGDRASPKTPDSRP